MSQYSFDKLLSGNICILRFTGYFDAAAGEELRQSVCDISSQSIRNLVLNLEKVSVINSPGITKILELTEDFVYERSGQVAMVGVSQLYQEVFQVVGLTSLATLCLDEKSALEKVSL